jgi:hypothetical protein
MTLHEMLTDKRFESQAESIHDLLEYFILEIEKDDWSGLVTPEMLVKFDSSAREAMKGVMTEYDSLLEEYESLEREKQAASDATKQMHIDDALGVLNE